MVIPSSELILNPDNSIYHLKLRPDEIADTIITVGDQDRVDMVAQFFDKVHLTRSCREFKTITGEYDWKPITVISTGIGTDNIDIVFNELDALANIDFDSKTIKSEHKQLTFIRIGTSGAISENIPLDSYVASRHAVGFDSLLHFYDSAGIRNSDIEGQIESPNQCYAVDCDLLLAEAFSRYTIPGITITAPGFYGPQARQLRLSSSFDFENIKNSIRYKGLSPTNLEMETSGIYGMSKLLGHRAISLNAILANRVTQEFSNQPQETVKQLILKSLDVIKDLKIRVRLEM